MERERRRRERKTDKRRNEAEEDVCGVRVE